MKWNLWIWVISNILNDEFILFENKSVCKVCSVSIHLIFV